MAKKPSIVGLDGLQLIDLAFNLVSSVLRVLSCSKRTWRTNMPRVSAPGHANGLFFL